MVRSSKGDLSHRLDNFKIDLLHCKNEVSLLDRIKMTKNRLEFDRKKNWQRWTLTLELDQNFTTTNINLWTWPKIENKINITTTMNINMWILPTFGHIHPLMFVVVVIFI